MAVLRLLTLLTLLRAAEAGITLEFGTKKKPPPQKAKAVEKKEEEKPQAPPPPPFVSRGWLMKKGRKRRNWKRRYFVLSDDWSSISYYEDERCLKERGRVNLGGARCDLGLDYVPKRAHVFAFTVRAGVLYLRSLGSAAVSRHLHESSPGEKAMGGLFSDFEAVFD